MRVSQRIAPAAPSAPPPFRASRCPSIHRSRIPFRLNHFADALPGYPIDAHVSPALFTISVLHPIAPSTDAIDPSIPNLFRLNYFADASAPRPAIEASQPSQPRSITMHRSRKPLTSFALRDAPKHPAPCRSFPRKAPRRQALQISIYDPAVPQAQSSQQLQKQPRRGAHPPAPVSHPIPTHFSYAKNFLQE